MTQLGVCYFPEHWDQALWAEDFRRMADMGLSLVRMGEFSWAVTEPEPGSFAFGWLDRAVDMAADAGLSVMLCTPTATPPKWLVDAHPDILAYDAAGRVRGFGSRRHYCFSSLTYRREAARITEVLAQRYGQHPAVTHWQTDNEYGCHSTTRSYSPAARDAFRLWLERRYSDIDALNAAWGTVFWSQTYRSFGDIDLPNLTVTEANPSHRLDFARFSSDQVISFNRAKVDILRAHAPGAVLTHNFMSFFTDYDTFAAAEDLDLAGWDSYPLGHLDQENYSGADKDAYRHQGHPDFAAFYHDLYRRAGRGRFAVIEQQPGPVNWAPHNPAPLDGMVQLWTVEAAAHGADLVSYFRWRQAPFAQEQFHAGLLRPDSRDDQGAVEVRAAAPDAARLASPEAGAARVALLWSYESQWMSEATSGGAGWDYQRLALDWYSAARRFGHNIDIVAPGDDLSGYALVLVPSLIHLSDSAADAFKAATGQVIFGPRTATMGPSLHLLQDGFAPLMPISRTRSQSLPPHVGVGGVYGDVAVTARLWREDVETECAILACYDDGKPLLVARHSLQAFTAVPDRAFLQDVIANALRKAGLTHTPLPAGVRRRSTPHMDVTLNYGRSPAEVDGITLPPARYHFQPKD